MIHVNEFVNDSLKMILFSLIFILVNLFGSINLLNIDCKYQYYSWNAVENTYECFVNNVINIVSKESGEINAKRGTHKYGKTENHEAYLHAENKIINFFPSNLEMFFKNLIGIIITQCHLKEVHEYNLRPHKKLTLLFLHYNDIEFLEEGLFDSSPNLRHLSFESNKFIHIYPKVFDKIQNLVSLYMNYNACISKGTVNNVTGVYEVIKSVKSNCNNLNYMKMDIELKKQEEKLKNLNLENLVEFSMSINTMENEIKISNFSSSFTVNRRIQNMKNNAISFSNKIKNKIFALEQKPPSCELGKKERIVVTKSEKQIKQISTKDDLGKLIFMGVACIIQFGIVVVNYMMVFSVY